MQINTKYEIGEKVWSANVFDKDFVFYGTIVEFETYVHLLRKNHVESCI